MLQVLLEALDGIPEEMSQEEIEEEMEGDPSLVKETTEVMSEEEEENVLLEIRITEIIILEEFLLEEDLEKISLEEIFQELRMKHLFPGTGIEVREMTLDPKERQFETEATEETILVTDTVIIETQSLQRDQPLAVLSLLDTILTNWESVSIFLNILSLRRKCLQLKLRHGMEMTFMSPQTLKFYWSMKTFDWILIQSPNPSSLGLRN